MKLLCTSTNSITFYACIHNLQESKTDLIKGLPSLISLPPSLSLLNYIIMIVMHHGKPHTNSVSPKPLISERILKLMRCVMNI